MNLPAQRCPEGERLLAIRTLAVSVKEAIEDDVPVDGNPSIAFKACEAALAEASRQVMAVVWDYYSHVKHCSRCRANYPALSGE